MYHALIYDTYMPQVSKIKLDKKAEQKLIRLMGLILVKIKTDHQMESFLLSFLTPTEKLMLAKRLVAIILIREGIPHSNISSSLHLTRATIARLELFSEARGQGYEVAIKILKKERIFEEVRKGLLKLVGYSIRAAGGHVKPSIV